MKYIDTNILIRVITGDDPTLAIQATTEIQRGAQNEFCVLDAILVEVCFVLEFHKYAMARKDIANALETLITTPQIFVSDTTAHTLKMYKEYPKLDYADCLLLVMGGREGILTFDKDLLKSIKRG